MFVITPSEIDNRGVVTNVPCYYGDPASWVSGESYTEGDVRAYDGLTYFARTTHSGETTTPDLDSNNWKFCGYVTLPWVSGSAYTTGTHVSVGTKVYVCIIDINPSNTSPESDTAHWKNTGNYLFWVSGTTYSADEFVTYDFGEYYAVQDITSATYTITPTEGAETIVDGVKLWEKYGSANAWAMFDGFTDSQTVSSADITVQIVPETSFYRLALFNVEAVSIVVDIYDGSGILKDSKTYATTDADVSNWFDFFFQEYGLIYDMVLPELPYYENQYINITFEGVIGVGSKVGLVIVGTESDIGEAVYDTSVSLIDFSTKEVDIFGKWTIVPRKVSKFMSVVARIEEERASRLQRKLSELTTVPAVWVADPNRESTIVYGISRDFNLTFKTPTLSDFTIDIEGL